MKLVLMMHISLIKKLEYTIFTWISVCKYLFLLIMVSLPLYAHQKTSLPSTHIKAPCFILSMSSKLTHHELYLSTLKIESRKAGLPWYWITTQQKSLCDSSDTIPQLTIDTQQFHFEHATYLSANEYIYQIPEGSNTNKDSQLTLLHHAELQAHHIAGLIIHLLLEQKQAAQVQGIPLFDLNDQINQQRFKQQQIKQQDLKNSQNPILYSSLLPSKDSSLLSQTDSPRKKLAQSANESDSQKNSKSTTKNKDLAQKSAPSLSAPSLSTPLPGNSKKLKPEIVKNINTLSQYQTWELQLGACYLYQFSSYLTTGPQLNIYYTPKKFPFQFSTLVSYLISPTTQQDYVSSTLQLTNVMIRVGVNLFQSKFSLDLHMGLGWQHRTLQANSSAQNTADHSQSNEIAVASLALESKWMFHKKYYLAWHATIDSYGSSSSYQWLDQNLYPASHIALGSMIAFGFSL
jgi:hypothetical protein